MTTPIEVDRTSRQFIARVSHQVRQGYGIVPFVGSGLSARSGILMGQQFTDYLAHVFYKVVGDDDQRWKLREFGWPKIPNRGEVDTARDWIKEQLQYICRRSSLEPVYNDRGKLTGIVFGDEGAGAESSNLAIMLNRPLIPLILRGDSGWKTDQQLKDIIRQFRSEENVNEPSRFVSKRGYSPSSADHVIETGIRSLHDWRATLEFLSRVDVGEGNVMRLQQRDPSIIDAFNVHITRDKQCNLGHKMLAHLNRPLRTRTILTTNFDDLIEEAYKRLEAPLKSLEVSIRGSLPHPTTVRMQNSLVKLHGGMLETRADYSLDSEPSNEDKDRFAEYVIGPLDSEGGGFVPNHLLVIGYSGSDLRCVQMIKHLLDVNREVRIFWICFNQDDLDKLNWLFYEKEYCSRIFAARSNRPDLLLYELYQELTLCLPAGGFAHEFTHKVPPERSADLGEIHNTISDLRRAVKEGADLMALAGQKCADQPRPAGQARKLARYAIAEELADHVVSMLKGKGGIPPTMARYARVHRMTNEDCSGTALTVNTVTGAAGAMRGVFDRLTKESKECIWLELPDYRNVGILLQEMLRIISLRRGTFQLEHVILNPLQSIPFSCDLVNWHDAVDKNIISDLQKSAENSLPEERISEEALQASLHDYRRLVAHLHDLKCYFNIDASNYVFLLYGRDVPGGCSGWNNSPWSKRDYGELRTIIHALTSVGFNIVYVPLSQARREREKHKQQTIKQCMDLVSHWFPVSEKETRDKDESKAIMSAWREFNEHQTVVDSRLPVKVDAADSINLPIDENNGVSPRDIQATMDSLSLYHSILENTLEHWLRQDFGPTIREELITPERQHFRTRLQFLYAITLFRQSRHTSAFFAEAVYSCPHRFNGLGIDNDWERARFVRDWINDLRALRIFYYKPGGYCWKYRDVRLGLKQLLEGIEPKEYGAISIDRKKSRLPDFFGQMRARLHFWIGDWYFKAFAATGHSMPVIECLYHRFMCAQESPYAKPGSLSLTKHREAIQEYRIVLFQSSLMEMIKTLLIARPWIKFWLGNVAGLKMFADRQTAIEHLKSRSSQLIGEIEGEVDKKDRLTSHHESLIQQLEQQLVSVSHSIQGEAGNYHGKIAVSNDYPEGFSVQLRDLQEQLNVEDVEGNTTRTFDATTVAKKDWKDRWKKIFKELGAKKLVWEDIAEAAFDPRHQNEQLRHRLNENKTRWIYDNSSQQAKVYLLVDYLGEFAYLHTIRFKLQYHASADCCGPSRYEQDWYYDTRELMVKATLLCNLGVDLCKHIFPSLWRYEMRHKIKLHTIYGLVLANLDRFYEAHRHLNEATALLTKMHDKLDPRELAIIRLRRAEVYVTEALRLHDVLGELSQLGNNGFGDWRNEKIELRKDLGKEPDQVRKMQLHPLLHEPLLAEEGEGEFRDRVYRMHVASLDDAWTALESAEQLIAGRSHSSLWWGRLATLKLRVYGAHWHGAPQHDSPKHHYESLAFRKREQRDSSLTDLFRKAIMTDPTNELRRIRAIHYYMCACRRVLTTEEAFDDAKDEAKSRLPGGENMPKLLKQYHDKVDKFITDASLLRKD